MTMARSRWVLAACEVGVTALVIAGVWLYTANTTSYVLTPLPDIVTAFRETWLFGAFTSDFVPSMIRLVLGYALSVVVGVALGFALGSFRTVRVATQPVVTFVRSIPAAALVPLAIVLFGIGTSMKVFLIAFVCAWPIVLNTAAALAELDATVAATARSYGISGLDRVRFVVLPAASPRIFAGMRTSISLAVLLLVTSEMFASTNGVGYWIIQAQQSFDVSEMWGGILLLGILGYVLNWTFGLVERRVLRWHDGLHRLR